jgi:carbamate kinase
VRSSVAVGVWGWWVTEENRGPKGRAAVVDHDISAKLARTSLRCDMLSERQAKSVVDRCSGIGLDGVLYSFRSWQ